MTLPFEDSKNNFVKYTDQQGNLLASIIRDGTVQAQQIQFGDGTKQVTAASGLPTGLTVSVAAGLTTLVFGTGVVKCRIQEQGGGHWVFSVNKDVVANTQDDPAQASILFDITNFGGGGDGKIFVLGNPPGNATTDTFLKMLKTGMDSIGGSSTSTAVLSASGNSQSTGNFVGNIGQQDNVSAYTVNGAIAVNPGTAVLNAGGALAMTLGAPSSKDGYTLTITSNTAAAHTVVTPANGVNGTKTTLTFAASIGSSVVLKAFGTTWLVVSNIGVTVS